MAIVKSILEADAEASSTLINRTPKPHVVANFENSWIVKFIRVLNRGVPFADRRKLFNNVAFIVFNYDRCLEHFLLHAIRQLYLIAEPEALERS